MEYVRVWRHRLFKKIAPFQRRGYAIVTQDEGIFKDASLSTKYWAKIGLRIFLPWSGVFRRFAMLCSNDHRWADLFELCRHGGHREFYRAHNARL